MTTSNLHSSLAPHAETNHPRTDKILTTSAESDAKAKYDVVSVDYVIRAHWGKTWCCDVTIVTDCYRFKTYGVNGFEISLEIDHPITKVWGARVRREGNRSVFVNSDFHYSVDGESILYFGFYYEAAPSQEPVLPSEIIIDGLPCKTNSCFAREFSGVCADGASPVDSDNESSLASSRTESPVSRQGVHDSLDAFSDEAEKRFEVATPPHVPRALEASLPKQEPSTREDQVKEMVPIPRDVARDHTDVSGQISSSVGVKRKNPEKETIVEVEGSVPRTLTIEYYRRSEEMKRRKWRHMDMLDTSDVSREDHILSSVLDKEPIVLEPNMFPYDCPDDISHWTLWSKSWLQDEEVEAFMQSWFKENMPEAIEWNVDDNMADGLSINLFHLHCYIRSSVKCSH